MEDGALVSSLKSTARRGQLVTAEFNVTTLVHGFHGLDGAQASAGVSLPVAGMVLRLLLQE